MKRIRSIGGLLTRQPTCHERGFCQRTAPTCHRACHMVAPSAGEPPIGYEAAAESNIHQLQAEWSQAPAVSEQHASWVEVAAQLVGAALAVALLFGAVYMLTNMR